VLKLQ
jgi:hypothetical protein